MDTHIEIERKFLVAGDFMQDACDSQHIAQGYLCSSSGRTVRVRLKGEKGYLTIKGPTGENGMSRYEWEKEIPAEEASQLIALCESGLIDKTRYIVPYGDHTFEVDVFHGDNEGLVIAEVELRSEDEEFQRPVWLGKEVTGDRRYYNSMLIRHPYKMWDEQH